METVLVVDDEPIVRDVVVRYLERDGFRTLDGGRRSAARALIEGRRAEPGRPRSDASRDRWARALPLDPRPVEPARDHADRARRGDRPHRRARARRRRLPRQAFLAARACSPRAIGAPSRATEPRRRAKRSSSATSSSTAFREARRAEPCPPDRQGVRAALVPRRRTRPGLLARPAHGPRLGLRSRLDTGTVTVTSVGCARRSKPIRHPAHLQTVWGVGYRLDP